MIKGWIRKMNRLASLLAIFTLISACGGGGGGSDSGGGFVPPPAPKGASISITLTDIQGNEITEISPIKQGVFYISVKDPNGNPIKQEVVTGATTLGRVIPTSGTALTDDAGIAVLYVAEDGLDGAGTLTASMTYNDVESEGSLSYSVTTYSPPNSDSPEFIDDSGNIVVRKLGHINSSGSFVEGVIKVEPSGKISAGGTGGLTLAVADESLDLVSTPEVVTLTSNCLLGGLATLSPESPVSFISTITVNYKAEGCEGEDAITATLQSSRAHASGTIQIAPVSGESIAFDEAKTGARVIGIQGTGSASGLTEATNVFFTVTDGGSQTVEGTRVNFSLLRSSSDAALACEGLAYCDYISAEDETAGRSTQYTARSGADGSVSTTVLAGSAAGPIQVLAYIDTNDNGERESDEPSSVSKVLFVSTGVADQNSISLSAKLLNPYGSSLAAYKGGKRCDDLGYDNASYLTGGLEADGLCTEVAVRLADKFNHPVPDGTVATFVSEYGRILSSCLTVNGDCVVAWNSQNPRVSATVDQYSAPITVDENLSTTSPDRYDCPSHKANHGPCPDDIADPEINAPGAPRGGRSTVTVVVNGEESFIDRNGNGFYDEGEIWTNLTEAFTDHNEDGFYTPVQRDNCLDPAVADDVCLAGFEETYFDLNSNGLFDLNDSPKAAADSSLPDGLYNGVLCRESDAAQGICSRDLLQLTQSIQIILSPGASGYEFLIIDRNLREAGNALYGGNTYQFYLADQYNNPPPALTQIDITGGGGCSVINGSSTVPQPSSSKPGAYGFSFGVAADIESEKSASDPDQVAVTVTLPSGNSITEVYRCPVSRACDPNDPGAGFSPNCG